MKDPKEGCDLIVEKEGGAGVDTLGGKGIN